MRLIFTFRLLTCLFILNLCACGGVATSPEEAGVGPNPMLPAHVAALVSQSGVDGALIGGASLNADQFLAIVQAGISGPQTERESA